MRVRLVLGFVCLVGAAACHRGLTTLEFPLAWRGVGSPPEPSKEVAAAFSKQSVVLLPLTDIREHPEVIGHHDDTHEPIRALSSVPKFCDEHVREILIAAGLRQREGGSVEVVPELVHFEVVEGGTYQASVRIRFTVRRLGSAQSLSFMANGTSKRWGRSRSVENYNEALSNALEDAMKQLLQNAEFANAIAHGPPVLPG